MTLVPGDVLAGRYQVESRLGQGGMGSVFMVRERPTGARRVLKQLRAERPELLDAFRSEFSLLASVTDPNLMRVHDFGSSRIRGATVSYYVAEWIDGQRLSDFAQGAPAAKLLSAARDALRGLSALHDLGVRHGDFTPWNVLVDRKGRATLIDLGCARPFGDRSGLVSGTPGYLAPEVLATGGGDARADLFAVGVTLRHAFELSGVAPPAPIAALIERLSAADPALRPGSAAEVRTLLGEAARSRSGLRAISRRLVGRETQIAAFLEFVRAILQKLPRPRFLCLHGPPGAGTSRLLRELVARAELELPVLRAHASEPKAVRWLLTEATGWLGTTFNARTAIAAASHLTNAGEPRLLVLEDADRLDAGEAEALVAFARSLPETGPVALLVSSRQSLAQIPDEAVEVGPLDLTALRSWTESAISDGTLAEVLRTTGGIAGSVERELVRIQAFRGPEAAPQEHDEELGEILTGLSTEETAALALLVALEGEIDPGAHDLEAGSFASSLELGLVVRDRARIRLRDRDEIPLFRKTLKATDLEAAHAQVARRLTETRLSDTDAVREAEIVHHTVLAGRVRDAEQLLASNITLFNADPRALTHRASALLVRTRDAETLMRIAEIALLANEPRPALLAALRVLRLRPKFAVAAEARLLAADALIRLGRARRAERLAESLLKNESPVEQRIRAYERVARARMQRGDHTGAKAAAEEGLALDLPAAKRPLLVETLAVAEGYLGHTAEADAHFARVYGWLDAARQPRDVCRLLGHRAIAAFRSGRIADAARDHERALNVAEKAGLDDLVAVCLLNLGTAEQQLGNLGGALVSYERGLAIARAVSRESTELTLRYNLANLRAEIGDFAGAARELELLEQRALKTARAQFAPSIALLRTEVLIARQDFEAAGRELDMALPAFEERGLEREMVEAELCRAELDFERGAAAEAEQRAIRAESRARDAGTLDIAVRASLLRARVEIARHDPRGAERLSDALARAAEGAQRLLEARIATELYRALGLPEWADRARRAWDRMAANLPDDLRLIFWNDARREGLDGFTRQVRITSVGNEAEALRRLLSLSRRMNSSLSLNTVLEYALDAATELSGAERGFLLLLDGGEPRIAAARPSVVGGDPPSHSIVRKVLDSEEAVLTTDAQSDERFDSQVSIHALRLKSVLCVPIGTPASALGVLYVDSRVQRGRFGSADRALLLALGDQLAVALTNARLHAELEQRARELGEQKTLIERLSRGKDRELERLREEVEVQKRALGLRYDYSRIIGRGPKMRAMLEKLDRIIDSSASVLIQGESGTGKELIARALHVNGSRAKAPFVGVNCAALPEPLLESELFGHVRGAFTGADRDKKGLLLTADGGTLFLDEVGEMPLVTQAKLLRVLQEREVRPVGSSRAIPLDVRVVSATHRDLLAEVSLGRFREDLYYRLAVVMLEVPPLRERVEDLAALCREILTRLSRDAGRPLPELSTEALRTLAAHPFPGNVRELENVLTRAFVLSEGSKISSVDLDITQRPRPRRTSNRKAYESEERERILLALSGCRWNVSVVARQLGIPRNTLYRKLRKYGLEREPVS